LSSWQALLCLAVAVAALVGWAPGGGRRCGQSDIRGLGTA
jgi:hypothetical protein